MHRPFLSRIELAASKLHRLLGIVPDRVKTTHTIDGKPVYMLHNPKAAGSTLKALLGYTGTKTLHIRAHDCFSRRHWQNSFTVCAVREPFARFVSGYNYHVIGPYRGYLVKTLGEDFKTLTPEQYFEVMKQFPSHLGVQTAWCTYPSTAKPSADLILKTSNSAQWGEQLSAVGIQIPQKIPQKNSGPAHASPFEVSDTFAKQFLAFHAHDYSVLGYDIPAHLKR